MNILITGGTGLVGTHLIPLLNQDGHKVRILSRDKKPVTGAQSFAWDVEKGIVEKKAFEDADAIIHLAGESIGGKRWTEKQKKKILDSRVKSAQLLFKSQRDLNAKLKVFISASAIGYYGAVTTDIYFVEEDAPAGDFLGNVCRRWEEAADLFAQAGIRTVKIRTSPVLAKEAPLIRKMSAPVKLGLGAALGSGRQYFPWIHVEDLCALYRQAVNDETMSGPYNAAAPDQPTNWEFTHTMAAVLNKPLWLPAIPRFMLVLLFGELGKAMTQGSRVSVRKMLSAGFRFKFEKPEKALKEVFNKP